MQKLEKKITFFGIKGAKRKNLYNIINISDDKGITDFILSAMEFYGGVLYDESKKS